MTVSGLIIGGWILILGTLDSGATVVPTQYPTKEACESAASEAAKGLPSGYTWRCLKAGEGAKP